MSRSRLFTAVAGGLAAVLLGWVGWLLVGGRQVHEGVAWARQRMAEGQYAEARDRLARLAAWWPHDDEVAYLLGGCEAKLGRPDAAIAAWGPCGRARGGRARPGSRKAGCWSVPRAGWEMPSSSSGRRRPAGEPRRCRPDGRWPSCCSGKAGSTSCAGCSGRSGGSARPPIGTAALREHWRLDSVIVAAEEVAPVLAPGRADGARRPLCLAGPRAPGHAIRAIRRGSRLAGQVLRHPYRIRCFAGVLPRARLRWALAAGEPDEARRALAEIPDDRFDPEELWSLRAWFAARFGDPEAERDALEHVVAIEPGQTRRSIAWPSWPCGPAGPIAPRRSAAARRRPCATRNDIAG